MPKRTVAGWGRLNASGYFSVGSIVPDWVVMERNPAADFLRFDAGDEQAGMHSNLLKLLS